MTAIVCDSCKKVVPNARKDVNYAVHMEKDVCVACREELEDITKKQMLARSPYTFKDYWTAYTANLNKMCGR
jgi:hypothetical protein